MRTSLAVFLLLLSSGPAFGAPVFYASRAAFNAAAGGGLSFESFEVAPPSWAPSFTFAGFTVSETGGVDALTNTLINNHFTTCVTDGQGALWYDDNGQSVGTFFAFTNPVNAFGLDLTVDDTSSTITIGGSVSTSVFRSPDTPGFFGVIDTAGSFSSISFSASSDPCVGFDAVEYGTAGVIPEPASLLVWSLLGALGIGVAWWRRRRAA